MTKTMEHATIQKCLHTSSQANVLCLVTMLSISFDSILLHASMTPLGEREQHHSMIP